MDARCVEGQVGKLADVWGLPESRSEKCVAGNVALRTVLQGKVLGELHSHHDKHLVLDSGVDRSLALGSGGDVVELAVGREPVTINSI
jgi:hypothetical protein